MKTALDKAQSSNRNKAQSSNGSRSDAYSCNSSGTITSTIAP